MKKILILSFVLAIGLASSSQINPTASSLAFSEELLFTPLNGNFSSPVAALSYSQSGNLNETTSVPAMASQILNENDPTTLAFRSSGCSTGCSSGCSVGCSTGCSSGCSVGCSSGCSSGCSYGCK